MAFQVNPSDLEGIAGVFSGASSDVAQLRAVLAGQATAPESAAVIGSGSAAGQYANLLGQWTHALDQLSSSLETMSRKMLTVANAYAQTESANTAPTN